MLFLLRYIDRQFICRQTKHALLNFEPSMSRASTYPFASVPKMKIKNKKRKALTALRGPITTQQVESNFFLKSN